ncbi:MAG: fimbrillin family protein [Prevotella sp.]|nr:fimbrillin family protein [Prevotella sp.]
MKKIYYLFMSMTVILLAACSQDEMEQVKEGTLPELRVMVNHPSSISTRATVNDVTTSFESGDKIGVFVINSSGDMMKKNVAYEYDGTKWNLVDSSNKVYYSSNCSYYAYYPYVEKEDEDDWYYLINSYMDAAPTEFFSTFISSWEPLLDQSTLANFNASDLMIGKGIDNSETASVSFTMDHQMGLVRMSYYDWESDEIISDISSMGSWSYFYNEEEEEGSCPIPYNTGEYYYYITKPGTRFEFWCWNNSFYSYEQFYVDVDEDKGFITNKIIYPTY